MLTKYLLYNPQASNGKKLLYKISDRFYTASGLKYVYDSIDESTYTEITSFIVIYEISTHAVFVKTKTQWAIIAMNNEELDVKFGSFDPWNCPETLNRDNEKEKFYEEQIEFVEALRVPHPEARDTILLYYPSADVKPFPLNPYLNFKELAKQRKRINDIPNKSPGYYTISSHDECGRQEDSIIFTKASVESSIFSMLHIYPLPSMDIIQNDENMFNLEESILKSDKYVDDEDIPPEKEKNTGSPLEVIPFTNETCVTLDKSFVIKVMANMIKFEGVAVKNDDGSYTGEIRRATVEEKEEAQKLGLIVN